MRLVSVQEMLAAMGHGRRQGDQLHPPEFEIEVGRGGSEIERNGGNPPLPPLTSTPPPTCLQF